MYCTVRRNSGVQGLEVIVQSDRLPQYVDDRVEAFLHHMNVSILKHIYKLHCKYKVSDRTLFVSLKKIYYVDNDFF